MKNFNCDRVIFLRFIPNKNGYTLWRIKMDSSVKRLFERNGISLAKSGDSFSHPNICIRAILEFLGEHKLDQSLNESFVRGVTNITITLRKRGKYAHSG